MSFWCLQIFQKINEIFSRISALASKTCSNQKSSARESKWNYPISGTTCLYFFHLTSFKRLGQKSSNTKISLVFWEIWKDQKDISTFRSGSLKWLSGQPKLHSITITKTKHKKCNQFRILEKFILSILFYCSIS